MAVFVFTSAAGAPGVTTTALGVVLHWPESAMLVDGDYQQAILAGYLQGQQRTENGLANVINAGRITPDVREAVWRQCVPLPENDDQGRRRLLLPGLTTGQAATALWQSWPPVSAALKDMGRAGIDVIVDYGRLTPAGLHPALLEVSTQVLLLTRPTLRAVGAARWAAERLLAQAADIGGPPRLGLILLKRPTLAREEPNTGRRHKRPVLERAYSAHRVGQFLGIPSRGTIAHDPANARLLSDGGNRGPKFSRSTYAGSLEHLARSLNARARHRPQPHTEDGED